MIIKVLAHIIESWYYHHFFNRRKNKSSQLYEVSASFLEELPGTIALFHIKICLRLVLGQQTTFGF